MANDKFKEFREKMTACAKEMGVTLEMGSITYGDNSFSFRAKGYNGEDGKREEFERFAARKNVNPAWFGRWFKADDGKVFQITSILPRGRKYVLEITEKGTGTINKCGATYPRNFFVPNSNQKAIA